MPHTTPRTRPFTESVAAPASSARGLRGAVSLLLGDHELTFGAGTFIVGRGTDCEVAIDDPLVSRQHAKITVTNAAVLIEDLQSANGVYVNGARLHGSVALTDGDRILVGTREISVFTSAVAEESVDRPTLDAAGPRPVRELPAELSESQRSALTERADAFRFVGRLADKMLALNKNAEAERILFDHMTKVLHGARAGLPVPRDVLDAAGAYAMKLAYATRRGLWIDYGVELHLLARAQMSSPIVDALLAALDTTTGFNHALFRRYVATLGEVKAKLSPAEQLALSRLECIEVPGD